MDNSQPRLINDRKWRVAWMSIPLGYKGHGKADLTLEEAEARAKHRQDTSLPGMVYWVETEDGERPGEFPRTS